MSNLSSIAIRVHRMETMMAFYAGAFQLQFRPVDSFGIQSQFAEIDGITLKLVPIRESTDFEGFPLHQLGFTVPDIEAVVAMANAHVGSQEGEVFQNGETLRATVRDPDGNTIELYSPA